MKIEKTEIENTENKTDTKSDYVSMAQLSDLLNEFKTEMASMVSGAVNKVKKENKTIEEQVSNLLSTLETQKTESSEKTEKEDAIADNKTTDQQPPDQVISQIQELQKQIERLKQENEAKEKERLQILAETDKEKATTRFLNSVREKVTNPTHFLGSLLFEQKIKYDPEKKDYVIESKNQYGEVELIPSLDKIDDILRDPEYKVHLPARPGNGLSSTQGNNNQPTTNKLSPIVSPSLIGDPNFIGKIISGISKPEA